MLDGQFAAQNSAGAPGPGISVIVAPTGTVATPEHNKWIEAESATQKERRFLITDNLTHMQRLVLCGSEFCGTAILLFLGCAGCVIFEHEPSHLQICLTFGLAVMISVQCFGHVSGSHINPLVTVCAATLGTIPLIHVPIYWAGQMLGAIAGFELVLIVTPRTLIVGNNITEQSLCRGLCTPVLHPEVAPWQGLIVEFVISGLLALVCCGVWDVRNKTRHDSVPIKFGLTIAVLAIAGGPYSGGNMNPARSFAPALLNNRWDHHWIYWVGPLAGGFFPTLVYRLAFWKEPYEEEHTNAEALPLQDK